MSDVNKVDNTITKSIVSFLIIFASLFFIYKTWTHNICDKVLTFRINKVDSRFGISQAEVQNYAKLAANIWNNGLHKKVLEYSDKGRVSIDMVYDERQKSTIENNILIEQAKNKKDDLIGSREEIKMSLENINFLKAKFDADLFNFNSDMSDYNTRVANYNSTLSNRGVNDGGVNDVNMFNRLNEEKSNLENRRMEIEDEKTKLNQYIQNYNSDLNNFNNKVEEVNTFINEVNNNLPGQFEEGYYQDDKIVLYEYSDINTLKRLMAHELGHALGLDHTKDKNSIMYYINQAKNLSLTADDVGEYKRVCKVK